MNEYYVKKIQLVKELKKYFEKLGAEEIITPVSRRTSADIISRVSIGNGLFLRNCQESYMRLFTQIYDSVFEIGPSFRPEDCEDKVHGFEFLLLEAQFVHKGLNYITKILKNFVESSRNDFVCKYVSVYETIKLQLGVDLIVDGEEKLIKILQSEYPNYNYTQNYELINHYISDRIEPISKGKCIFFYEYPASTLSLARYCEKSKELVQRFEFFINGIEISNGYTYSNNVEEYIYRNQKVNLFTSEEEYLAEQFKQSIIPMDASVIGIGIERLCMALYDISDIRVLLRENSIF